MLQNLIYKNFNNQYVYTIIDCENLNWEFIIKNQLDLYIHNKLSILKKGIKINYKNIEYNYHIKNYIDLNFILTKPLWRIIVLKKQIIFVNHHCLFDGFSRIFILKLLLNIQSKIHIKYRNDLSSLHILYDFSKNYLLNYTLKTNILNTKFNYNLQTLNLIDIKNKSKKLNLSINNYICFKILNKYFNFFPDKKFMKLILIVNVRDNIELKNTKLDNIILPVYLIFNKDCCKLKIFKKYIENHNNFIKFNKYRNIFENYKNFNIKYRFDSEIIISNLITFKEKDKNINNIYSFSPLKNIPLNLFISTYHNNINLNWFYKYGYPFNIN